MKAPEKIYITPNFERRWFTKEIDDASVEYIRVDSFIEKACKWLNNNLAKYSELTNEDEYGNKLNETVMNVFYGQAVIDFQAYMKGESV